MRLSEINSENISNDIIKRVLFSIDDIDYDKADVMIIFGCHIKQLLDERIERAIEIFREKNVSKILLTGGIGVKGDFNEAYYMKEKLIQAGIDESCILLENKSKTTYENVKFCIEVLNDAALFFNKKIILVSSQAHLRRIRMLFKKELVGYKFNFIYEYPKNSMVSFEKVCNDDRIKEMGCNEVKKIIELVQKSLLFDEEIDI